METSENRLEGSKYKVKPHIVLIMLIVFSVMLVACDNDSFISQPSNEGDNNESLDMNGNKEINERFSVKSEEFRVEVEKTFISNPNDEMIIDIITDEETKCQYMYVKDKHGIGNTSIGHGGITPLLNDKGEPTCD